MLAVKALLVDFDGTACLQDVSELLLDGFGIAPDRAQNFHADSEGVELNFRVMSRTVAAYREGAPMASDWGDEIKKDYAHRVKHRR